jgi:hypothetical protein
VWGKGAKPGISAMALLLNKQSIRLLLTLAGRITLSKKQRLQQNHQQPFKQGARALAFFRSEYFDHLVVTLQIRPFHQVDAIRHGRKYDVQALADGAGFAR